jgi:YesN/AraC family two-component response regulator
MKRDSTSVKLMPSETSINMMSYVQMAGNFQCNEAYVAKRKKFDSILVVSTISGKGHLKYRNRNFETVENTGFIIDCNEPQVYFSDKKDLWHFIWVHFKGGQSTEQVRFILENTGPLFNSEKEGIINKSIQKIFNTVHMKGMYCDILTSSFLNDIITDIMLKSLPGGRENILVPEMVKQALSIIETAFSNEINMDELAGKLFTNKFELIRKFKRFIGITPYDYLIKYRINEAKTFLENTLLSVSEIAHKVGFEDASYFIKVFREHEATTPLRYRKNWGKVV